MNVVKDFFCDLCFAQIESLTVHKKDSDITMFLIHASLFILSITFMLLKFSSWSDPNDKIFKIFVLLQYLALGLELISYGLFPGSDIFCHLCLLLYCKS